MEFNKDGTLDVSMFKYLDNVIRDFPGVISSQATTLVADYLFDIRDKTKARALEEEKALAFHHTVAQLLFMSSRARRDIQTAVAFPTTRVKCPNKDDWGKLKQELKYLNGTRYLKLKLSMDNLGMLKLYMDVSHNMHWDSKGHRGAVFTVAKGAISSYLRKVKMNT